MLSSAHRLSDGASFREAVRTGDNGSWLAVDPVRMEALIEGIGTAVSTSENAAHRPVVVCAAQLRACVRRLLASARPDLKVLSYSELSRSVTIEPGPPPVPASSPGPTSTLR